MNLIRSLRGMLEEDKYIARFLAVLLCFELFLIVYFVFYSSKANLSSDAAAIGLYAGEIINNHTFFPSAWVHADTVPILFQQLYYLPFLLFLPNSFFVHSLAGLLNLVVLGGVFYYFLRASKLSLSACLVVLVVFFSGVSTQFSDVLFDQGGYAPVLVWSLATLVLMHYLWEHFPASGWMQSRRYFYTAIGTSILMALSLAGGMRYFLTFALPLAFGCLVFVLLEREYYKQHRKGIVTFFVVLAVGTVVGYLFYRVLDQNLFVLHDKQNAGLATIDDLKTNLILLFQGIIVFVGANFESNNTMLSVHTAIVAFKFCFYSFLFVLPIWLVANYRRLINPRARFFLLYTLVTWATTLYFLLFSKVIVDVSSSRYLLVPLVLNMAVLGFFFDEFWLSNSALLKKTFLYPGLIVVLCLPLVAFGYRTYLHPEVYSRDNKSFLKVEAESNVQKLAEFLPEAGLDYCYSTYWNANAATVLSAQKAKVRAVMLIRGQVGPYLWLSSIDWYDPEYDRGDTCLVLSRAELANQITEADLAVQFGAPASEYEVDQYKIFRYNYDVAVRFRDFYGLGIWN